MSFFVLDIHLQPKIKDKPQSRKTPLGELWRPPLGFSSIFINLIADNTFFLRRDKSWCWWLSLPTNGCLSFFMVIQRSRHVNLISSVWGHLPLPTSSYIDFPKIITFSWLIPLSLVVLLALCPILVAFPTPNKLLLCSHCSKCSLWN